MDVSDRSDMELAEKLGKDANSLTVGDVIESLPKVKRMLLEIIFDNYINGRQNKLETQDDISKLLPHLTGLEQKVILYLASELFTNPKWQKIRREAKKLNEEEH